MQLNGQPLDDTTEGRRIQDVFAVLTRSFSREEVVPVHDHGPLIPRRRKPRFSSWSTLTFVFIVFSLIPSQSAL